MSTEKQINERAEFEKSVHANAELAGFDSASVNLARSEEDANSYADPLIQSGWRGWQDRAALAGMNDYSRQKYATHLDSLQQPDDEKDI